MVHCSEGTKTLPCHNLKLFKVPSSSHFCVSSCIRSQTRWSTRSSSAPQPLMLLLCSILHHTPAVLWESSSVTTACTRSSSTTTCPSRSELYSLSSFSPKLWMNTHQVDSHQSWSFLAQSRTNITSCYCCDFCSSFQTEDAATESKLGFWKALVYLRYSPFFKQRVVFMNGNGGRCPFWCYELDEIIVM